MDLIENIEMIILQGWWKGELKGKIGLFPDNFVELLVVKNGEQEQKQELSQVSKVNKGALPVPTTKSSHSNKRSEKAHVRKSVDLKNVRTGAVLLKFPAIFLQTNLNLNCQAICTYFHLILKCYLFVC